MKKFRRFLLLDENFSSKTELKRFIAQKIVFEKNAKKKRKERNSYQPQEI
jgi:hypothetical protein